MEEMGVSEGNSDEMTEEENIVAVEKIKGEKSNKNKNNRATIKGVEKSGKKRGKRIMIKT